MWVRARLLSMVVLCGSAASAAQTAAQADPVADFYKGREIRLIVGQPPGGGYDAFARLFARHLGRLMPGNPTVIPQNMPGAAGMAMTNSLVAVQPRDGTVIGAASGQIGTAALFGAPGARYDARELGWIGSLNSEVGLVVARKDVPVRRFADLLDHELIVGASFATDSNVIYPTTMNAVLGTKFKIIPGYGGTSNVAIAIERGEVQGTASWHVSSIMAAKPDWIAPNGFLTVLLQLALKRHPAVPDVPTVIEVAKTDEQRAILELIFAQQDMGRPVYGPPGMPADRLAALRAAFDAFVADSEVRAEVAKMRLEMHNPMRGAEIAAMIARLYAMPPDVIQKAAAVSRPAQ